MPGFGGDPRSSMAGDPEVSSEPALRICIAGRLGSARLDPSL